MSDYPQSHIVHTTDGLTDAPTTLTQLSSREGDNATDGNEANIETAKGKGKYREREQWANKFEFILACMAYAIGLGNVWRFPYLCYKNGGGAFIIPYFIFLIFGAIPILFMEVGIGQYFRNGGITVWGLICPLFKGVGYGTLTVAFLLNCYYIVIISWALLYLYYSFNWVLPWSHCNNSWNTDKCWSPINSNKSIIPVDSVNSVTEFWDRKILQISPGIDSPDGLQWELTLTLFIAWIICFFCIWRGIKSTGKAVYFTAIFPYIVITALFIRGITLPGAGQGIKFYLYPEFHKLLTAQVWVDAGTQIFFSYAIALGCMTALGSYNKFDNNFYHSSFFAVSDLRSFGMNSGTSFYAGFAIFSVLGFMAHEQGVLVSEVAEVGPGLAFVAYPRAVMQMPGATFWAICFFIMILLLGLGSQFVGVEGFITAIVDVFPDYLRYGHRREYFIGGTCLISFFIGLSMVTRGGMYVFQLFDQFAASGMALLWFCFFESIIIGWIYGADRFYNNVTEMIGFRIIPWFKLCWKYFTPAITSFVFIFYAVTYKPLTYNQTYEYPDWAIVFGWSLAVCSMIVLPIHMIYIILTAPGANKKEKLNFLLTPSLTPYYETQQSVPKYMKNSPCNGDSITETRIND